MTPKLCFKDFAVSFVIYAALPVSTGFKLQLHADDQQ